MRTVLRALVCALPMSSIKRQLLRALGYSIAADAVMRPCLLWKVERCTLGPGASIGFGNTFRSLREVRLGANALIGQWNWVSGSPEFPAAEAPRELMLGHDASFTSRHYIDATGGIYLGDYSVCGGQRSTFLTHGAQYRDATVTARPITIGVYCLVNSNCTVLAGTVLHDRVVVGAHALITGELDEDGLYLGPKARRVRDVEGRWFDRTSGYIDPSAPAESEHDAR